MNPPPPQRISASIDIAATALGAESGPYILPASGCRSHHRVAVYPAQSMTMPAGFVVSAIRAETNQIRFWVRNLDGANPADPAAVTFTGEWGIPGS